MKTINFCCGICLLTVAGAFFYLIYREAVNIPYLDDFAFFNYTLSMTDASDFGAFWEVLWKKHGDHQIVLSKISFGIQYLMTGQLNFRHRILAEALYIPIILYLFYYTFCQNNVPFWYLLPVGLVLFTPVYYMNVFWSCTAWQNMGAILLMALCFYFLSSESRFSFPTAMGLGILLMLTGGNGWFCLYVGGFLLFLQKRFTEMIRWLLFCFVLSALFLENGTPNPHQNPNAYYIFQTMCVFLGGVFIYVRMHPADNFYGGMIIVTINTLFIAALVLTNLKIIKKPQWLMHSLKSIPKSAVNSALVGVICSLMITAIGAGILRQSPNFTLWPHYMIYAVAALLSFYTLIIILLRSKLRVIVGVVGVGFAFFSVIGSILWAVPEVIVHRKQLVADAFKLKFENVGREPDLYVNPVTMGMRRFQEAIKRGLYTLPATPLEPLAKQVFGSWQDTFLLSTDINLLIEKEETTGRAVGILNRDIQAYGDHSAYLILKNTNETYLIAPNPNLQNNRMKLLTAGVIFQQGFKIDLFKTNYRSGNYKIGLILPDEAGRYRVVYTRYEIVILNPV